MASVSSEYGTLPCLLTSAESYADSECDCCEAGTDYLLDYQDDDGDDLDDEWTDSDVSLADQCEVIAVFPENIHSAVDGQDEQVCEEDETDLDATGYTHRKLYQALSSSNTGHGLNSCYESVQGGRMAGSSEVRYHVFFIYNPRDQAWVQQVTERLQAPGYNFTCGIYPGNADGTDCLSSPHQAVNYAMQCSLKTVLVLSPDFMQDAWISGPEGLLTDAEVSLHVTEIIAVLLSPCDIPTCLLRLEPIDACRSNWWIQLINRLPNIETDFHVEDSLMSVSTGRRRSNNSLQSGELLASVKSRYRCCGREIIESKSVPAGLLSSQTELPAEEYKRVVDELMLDIKFRFHVWCYNVPGAILAFSLLLALCLLLLPIMETYAFHLTPSATGVEFLHGVILWLCLLTLYIVLMHAAKRKMKASTFRRLKATNATLIKYNLLAGVENLGIAECNKYYIHFFYYDVGPCLAHLQETIVTSVRSNQRGVDELGFVSRDTTMTAVIEVENYDEDTPVTITNDMSEVLHCGDYTNAALQLKTEDIMLSHCGEYISNLVTKKLARPERMRHIRTGPCLCQHLEQKVLKINA